MTDKKSPTKLEITQDKLVDYLMHAATREDLKELHQETNKNIDVLRQEIKELRKDTNSQFKWLVGLMFVGFFSMTGVMGVLIKILH